MKKRDQKQKLNKIWNSYVETKIVIVKDTLILWITINYIANKYLL